MKRFMIVVFLFLSVSVLSARQENRTVPISSDAYRIISVGELRGIIETQSDVRPYSLGKVLELLDEIKGSGLVSPEERSVIESVVSELQLSFGGRSADSITGLFKEGSFRVVDEEKFFILGGGRIHSVQTIGTNGAFDSRNGIQAYISGDIGKSFSFSMDIGLIADHLDHRAMLATDFTTDIEGWYMDIFNGGGGLYKSPFRSDFDDFVSALKGFFGFGYSLSPEIGTSLLDGKISARFASTKRDWGPGQNNLVLSGSARSFDAIEVQYTPTSRFLFSVLVGSLGKAWVELEGEPVPVGDREMHSDVYDNNISIQRIEVGLTDSFKASIYESVVWRKRAELAYWNPLSVYMYAQNYLGDFDNVLAGMDFSYTIKGFGRIYFGFAFDEFNKTSLKTIFTAARNIMAFQGGALFSVPWLPFGRLAVQVTYIPPFFGPHYLYAQNPWGTGLYGSAYVNKGQAISYPLYPDSLELLLRYEATLPADISLEITVKDQMRSAQYSVTESGTGLDDYMRYSIEYEDRQFFSYLWNNIVDLEVKGTKAFEDIPLKLSFGIQCIVDARRSLSFNDNVRHYPLNPAAGDNECAYEDPDHLFNPGNGTIIDDDWVCDLRLAASIGVSVYY